MFDSFQKAWADLGANIIGLLPTSPTIDSEALQALSKYAAYVNYYIPIGPFLTYFSALLAAVAVYYVVSVILRWLKVIS